MSKYGKFAAMKGFDFETFTDRTHFQIVSIPPSTIPGSNSIEFDGIRNQAEGNRFSSLVRATLGGGGHSIRERRAV